MTIAHIRQIALVYLRVAETMRDVAEITGEPLWKVHRMLSKELQFIDRSLYKDVRRKIEYNKADAPRRGGHGTARVTYDQAEAMRILRDAGWELKRIAAVFEVCESEVGRVCRGELRVANG